MFEILNIIETYIVLLNKLCILDISKIENLWAMMFY